MACLAGRSVAIQRMWTIVLSLIIMVIMSFCCLIILRISLFVISANCLHQSDFLM